MLDHLMYDTFDLDFKIYQAVNTQFKNYKNEIEDPKLKSDDIFKEFENYIQTSSKIFYELNGLLTECNLQRESMRTILIKMSKDKILIQKFFKDEDNSLILSKLQLHDELKTLTHDKNLDAISHMNKTISNLQTQLAFYKMEMIKNSSYTTLQSLSNGNVNSKSTLANKNGGKIKSESKKVKSKVELGGKNNNGKVSNHKETKNFSVQDNKNKLKTENVKNDLKIFDVVSTEIYSKNFPNLNLDFNTEKYNIISASPIMTPKENKTKVTNFNSIIGKLNNINNSNNHSNNNVNKPSDYKEGSRTEREPSKIYSSNYVEHERQISLQVNKKNNLNFIPEVNLKKLQENKNDSTKENGKSLKSTTNDIRNLDTKTNFTNNSNFSQFNNSNNSNDKNSTRKQMLNSISKSIDFDVPYVKENNFQSKLSFKNEVNITSDDPLPDTLQSYRNSVNPTPNTRSRQDYSYLTNDHIFLLNEIETDINEREKNSDSNKIQRKKRNSMSELIFSNFLNKYNIMNSYSRKESLIREENNSGNIVKNSKEPEKINKVPTTFKPLNKKNSMNNVHSNMYYKNKPNSKSIMNTSYGEAASPNIINSLAGSNMALTISNQKIKNSIKSFNTGYKDLKSSSKI